MPKVSVVSLIGHSKITLKLDAKKTEMGIMNTTDEMDMPKIHLQNLSGKLYERFCLSVEHNSHLF